jgi:hypothetical protein
MLSWNDILLRAAAAEVDAVVGAVATGPALGSEAMRRRLSTGGSGLI